MKKILLYSLLLLANLQSCNQANNYNQLQEGDLLFQNLNCGPLCDAIEAVTEGANGKDYSHISLVVKINDTLKVLEAIGDKVQINSLKTFFTRSGDTLIVNNITHGRLKPEFQPLINKAVAYAKSKVGEPYDDAFLPNNNKWYCSELLYAAFKEANNGKEFFSLEPMTFKDHKTHNYFPAWVDYYKALNIDIPEGEAGINPGGISTSAKIEIIGLDKTHF